MNFTLLYTDAAWYYVSGACVDYSNRNIKIKLNRHSNILQYGKVTFPRIKETVILHSVSFYITRYAK